MSRAVRGARRDRTALTAVHLLALFCCLSCTLPSVRAAHRLPTSSPAPPVRFAVFGYLPEYRLRGFAYEAFFKAGLTHLIFFSAEPDPETGRLLHVDDRLPAAEEWRRIRNLATRYDVKLLLCVGGGGRSTGFSSLVADGQRRHTFVEEVKAVMLKRELDGIDFNWEYPQSMSEWLSFGQLLRELRSVFDELTTVDHHRGDPLDGEYLRSKVRHATLSMALHPHPAIPSILQAAQLLRAVDFIHWMAYDHVAPSESHSSVEYARSVLQEEVIASFDEAVYRKRHEPPSSSSSFSSLPLPPSRSPGAGEATEDHRRKLTLGIPFYGRHRSDPRRPPETYAHLWSLMQKWVHRAHPTWEEDSPELRALSEYDGYSFTGYTDVRRKMRLAHRAGVAGIMIWELGQDVPPGTSPMSLMLAVQEQLSEWRDAQQGSSVRSTIPEDSTPTANPLTGPISRETSSVDKPAIDQEDL